MTVPLYESWDDYLAKTTPAQRLSWCARKARRANEYRWTLARGIHTEFITWEEVWAVLEAALGLCYSCGSLAVEKRQKCPEGTAWEVYGRRVGSLDHQVPIAVGGINQAANLAWCCAYCNSLLGGYTASRL